MSLAEKTVQSIRTMGTRGDMMDIIKHMLDTKQILNCETDGDLFMCVFTDASIMSVNLHDKELDLNTMSNEILLKILCHYYPFDDWLKTTGKGSYEEIRGNVMDKINAQP